MKHLLDIKYFLTEALPLEFQKKYKKHFEKRTKEVQDRLNKLLGNKERVYLPYNSTTISETQKKVETFLNNNGYRIVDYKLNSAVQIENSKRTIRISKLLAKTPDLLKEFTLDDTRANTRAGSEFSIVLTSNYEDVAGMSFCRVWGSCMDIKSGSNKGYVKQEVKQGTVVAYLIKSDDLEIEAPLGRVNIKPYYSTRDEKEVIYVSDLQVYGNVPDERFFIDRIDEYLKEKQVVKVVGFYRKDGDLYSDGGSPYVIMVKNDYSICYDVVRDCKYDDEGFDLYGRDKDGYNREGLDRFGNHKTGIYPHQEHLTREQYNWVKWVVSNNSSFLVDNEGLVNVIGDVYCQNLQTDRFPVSFGVVTGVFACCFNNLTSLIGSPREVHGNYYCNNNNLKSLEGAPKEVGGHFDCSNQKNGHKFTKEEVRTVSNVVWDVRV